MINWADFQPFDSIGFECDSIRLASLLTTKYTSTTTVTTTSYTTSTVKTTSTSTTYTSTTTILSLFTCTVSTASVCTGRRRRQAFYERFEHEEPMLIEEEVAPVRSVNQMDFWLSSFIDSMWAAYVWLQERNGGGSAACRAVSHSQVRKKLLDFVELFYLTQFSGGPLVAVSKRQRRLMWNRSSVKLVRRSIMETIGDTEVSFSRNTIQSSTSPSTLRPSPPTPRSAARNRRSSAMDIRPAAMAILCRHPL